MVRCGANIGQLVGIGSTLVFCLCLSAAELKPPPAADHWALGPEITQIHWDVKVHPIALSPHQRLQATVQVIVPGKELERLRGKGHLDLKVRYQDASGGLWSRQETMDLASLPVGLNSRQLTMTSAAFVLPGEYQVAIAVSDSETGERSLTRRSLHVAPLRNDPFPASWNGLPAVEILPMTESPDSWFLPSITERIALDAKPLRSVDIELLVNTTPTEFAAGSMRGFKNVMTSLIPAVKVLSSLRPRISFLDATNHKLSYQQTSDSSLQWDALKRVVVTTRPNIIDAAALAGHYSMKQYFATEVEELAKSTGRPHVVIVLSNYTDFAKEEAPALLALPADPNRRVFYLRMSAPQSALTSPGMEVTSPRIRGPLFGRGPGNSRLWSGTPSVPDDLEKILKSVGAQVFHIAGAAEFRKALAAVLNEIARM